MYEVDLAFCLSNYPVSASRFPPLQFIQTAMYADEGNIEVRQNCHPVLPQLIREDYLVTD